MYVYIFFGDTLLLSVYMGINVIYITLTQYEVDTITTLLFTCEETEELSIFAQGHIASKWQSPDS